LALRPAAQIGNGTKLVLTRPEQVKRAHQTSFLGPEVVGDPMPRADIYRVLGFTATAFTELIRVIDIFCALRQESDGKIL
jgi:hypothetical protein